MFAIEFQAQIKNGVIEVPVEKRSLLQSKVNGDSVRIIVLTSENSATEELVSSAENAKSINRTQDAKAKGYDSFLDYLLDHPVRIPEVTYLSREEANAR